MQRNLVRVFLSLLVLWIQLFAAGPTAYSQLDWANEEGGPAFSLQNNGRTGTETPTIWDELTILLAIDGSKQPQDFGVNANFGGTGSFNLGLPVSQALGIGAQVGTGITASANAVRVYELVGESTGRVQNFTSVGVFQRLDNGWSYGLTHDFLYQNSFDRFNLGQWRWRVTYDASPEHQFGVTTMLRSFSDDGLFLESIPVNLRTIDQLQFHWRRYWETGAQTTFWVGLAEGHGEDNAVTGFSPPQDECFLFGADILMPLTETLALYGETNLIMPADTGTVDAFLGIQWSPRHSSSMARRGRYSPLLPLAAPTSFAVDLVRQ